MTQNDWIPVTERLPLENLMVLATVEHYCDPNNIMIHTMWRKDGKWTNGMRTFNENTVIAWMPMPEPYEG